MNEEEEMMSQIVGGNVFEFSTEMIHLKGGSTSLDMSMAHLSNVGDSYLPCRDAHISELTKKQDAGKYGVGYFQPDNCDNVDIPCEYVPYPEFDNLKKQYGETKNSTLSIKDYDAPKKILECPSTMSIDLPPTPDVKIYECSVAQPVCNGANANAFKKDDSQALAMGETKKPSNVGVEEEEVAGNATPAPESSGSSAGSGDVGYDGSESSNAAPAAMASAFLPVALGLVTMVVFG